MPVPPVLPFTTTYAVTAEILVGWDTPPKITHPFAPTNGSLDASISGVKFTTVETRKDANKALISTDTYYSTRARPIAGEFVYTIKDASVTTATFGHVWRRDKNTNIENWGDFTRASSLDGVKLNATQDADGSFSTNGHLVTAKFIPDPEEIDISTEVLTPKQIADGQTYTVSLSEVEVDKYIQVYKGDPRLRWEPTQTYFYIMDDVTYAENASAKGDGIISYEPAQLVQEIGVRNETSVEARFKSTDGNYWSWDDAGVSSESEWDYGFKANPAKCTVTFTTF